jgi:hypothetical protein
MQSLRSLDCVRGGINVIPLQEDKVALPDITQACLGADLFLWTRTGGWLKCNGFEMLARIKIPTVGVHLDRFWGLNRETEVTTTPFFVCRYVFTADGGSDDKWGAAGVNHFWLNPGVLKSECRVAWPRVDLRTDVGFVGARGYHPEHYRGKLIDFLTATYGNRFRLFGANGDCWRGNDLNQVYASIKVAVGDSCFADRCVRYTSDRLFEGCGRGACTAFPRIPGIDGCYTDGVHLRWYEPGNFADMKRVIDEMLLLPEESRQAMRVAAVEHTRQHHTYNNRMTEMLNIIAAHEPAIKELLA